MKTYEIKAGFSFLVSPGKVLASGELIELEDDVAKLHSEKIELVADDVLVTAETA